VWHRNELLTKALSLEGIEMAERANRGEMFKDRFARRGGKFANGNWSVELKATGGNIDSEERAKEDSAEEGIDIGDRHARKSARTTRQHRDWLVGLDPRNIVPTKHFLRSHAEQKGD